MSDPAVSPRRLEIPELGPSIGQLAAPPGVLRTRRGPVGIPLDDLRLALVTEVFELAGAAREFTAAGDRAAAVQSLNRSAWLGVWERLLAAVAQRLADTFNARLTGAARESRLPESKLQRILITPQETSAIAARLGSGAASLIGALDALDRTVPRAGAEGARGDAAEAAWREALLGVARRLESAWVALENAAAVEERRWDMEVARVRAWRRPRWPLWIITAIVFAVVTYLGLALGRYIPAPAPIERVADWWWNPQ